MKNTIILVASVAIAGLIGFAVGFYGNPEIEKWQEERLGTTDSSGLTNPLLECTEAPEQLTIGNRAEIEREVVHYVDNALKTGEISDSAIYFRDLNNGPWFGINERTQFTPGSLLKLPLAMSYYVAEELNPGTLDQSIEYEGSDIMTSEEIFGSGTPLPSGIYTLRELIATMLMTSSNDAALLLAQTLSTYQDLGIEVPHFGQDYLIDVKTFGAFFRVLYNASYPGKRGAEEILATLTKSTFTEGIVAGVPAGTLVAHKFGTRSIEGDPQKQLHDCGIVYAQTPYILCIMTRGTDFDALTSFITRVSAIVYTGVMKSNP